MASRATTPTTAAAIVAAYVAGAPVKAICARFFISRFVMTQAVKAAGVPRRPRGRPRTTKETTMLEELRRVLAAATPGPWSVVTEEESLLVVQPGADTYICDVGTRFIPDSQADAALIAAAVNAAPALLAVADAARELQAATIALDLADERPSSINAAYHREYAARAALWAALEALETPQ